MIDILKDDPSSALAAAIAGWSHPMSREALLLADIFDLDHMSKAKKKPPAYPRPWATDRTHTRKGNAAGRTRDQVIEILRRARHGETTQGGE